MSLGTIHKTRAASRLSNSQRHMIDTSFYGRGED